MKCEKTAHNIIGYLAKNDMPTSRQVGKTTYIHDGNPKIRSSQKS